VAAAVAAVAAAPVEDATAIGVDGGGAPGAGGGDAAGIGQRYPLIDGQSSQPLGLGFLSLGVRLVGPTTLTFRHLRHRCLWLGSDTCIDDRRLVDAIDECRADGIELVAAMAVTGRLGVGREDEQALFGGDVGGQVEAGGDLAGELLPAILG